MKQRELKAGPYKIRICVTKWLPPGRILLTTEEDMDALAAAVIDMITKGGRAVRELLCTKCGESWEPDVVIHKSPERFVRSGASIWECPSCEENAHLPYEITDLLRAVYHGYAGDVDAAANDIERITPLVEEAS